MVGGRKTKPPKELRNPCGEKNKLLPPNKTNKTPRCEKKKKKLLATFQREPKGRCLGVSFVFGAPSKKSALLVSWWFPLKTTKQGLPTQTKPKHRHTHSTKKILTN